MNNRFRLGDIALLVVLGLTMVAVVYGMKRGERQQSLLQAIDTHLAEQTLELGRLRQTLGVAGSGSSSGMGAAGGLQDPFKYVKLAQARPDYAQGDWLVDTFSVRVPTITPFVSKDLYAMIVQGRVVESLAYTDPYTLDDVPLLARSWQISPDGLTITFQLRQAVVFSDGEPFTADDVVYSFQLPMNEQIAAPRYRAYLENIQEVVKTGTHEVVFKFKRPYFASFSLAAGVGIIPQHFYQKYNPEEINQSTGLLMGTGPYRMKDPTSWKPGTDIELVRNENYWGEPGAWDKVVWRYVEEESAAMTMFVNGELDHFLATPEQYREMVRDQELLQRKQHFEDIPVTAGYYYIGWNQKVQGTRPTAFADKRVRRAMTMLIDRNRMMKELMYGYAREANGPFGFNSPQRDPDTRPLEFDPARAMALLREAGYIDRNGDGVLESPGGEPFRFKFCYLSKLKLAEQTALFVKDALAKAGIVVEPDPEDWPIMMKKVTSRDFEAITLGWASDIESDPYQAFHSSQIQDNGDNYVSYSNPELDRLIDRARATVDRNQRMPLWHQVNRILNEDQPYTFLYDRMKLNFMDRRIRNVETTRVGLTGLLPWAMPCEWYVPRGAQKWK